MARICFLWIQELPPDQTGQEEAVNSHGHHLGRMPRDTPGQREFPASPCSSTPHSSKGRLCSLGKALDSVLTGFLQEVQKATGIPFSLQLLCTLGAIPCCPWNDVCAGVTGQWQQQARDILDGLEAVSWLSPCWQRASKSGKGTLALLFAPSFLLLMLSFY